MPSTPRSVSTFIKELSLAIVKLARIHIQIEASVGGMGKMQSRNSLDKEAEINTRAGDKKRMKKLDKDIRKTFFFAKDMVGSKDRRLKVQNNFHPAQVTSDSEMAAIMERLFKEIDGHDGDGALTPEELVELEASLGLTISLEVFSLRSHFYQLPFVFRKQRRSSKLSTLMVTTELNWRRICFISSMPDNIPEYKIFSSFFVAPFFQISFFDTSFFVASFYVMMP